MSRDHLGRLLVRSVLAVAAAGLITAAAIGPADAAQPATNAAVQTQQQSVAAMHVTTPRDVAAPSVCPLNGGVVTFYLANCGLPNPIVCTLGFQGFPYGSPDVNVVRYVSNGCNARVWLYTGTHRTGNTLCVNPRTADQYLHQLYIWFWISSNNTNC